MTIVHCYFPKKQWRETIHKSVFLFCTKQPLTVTASGHYAISIGERASLEEHDEKKQITILQAKTVGLSNKEKTAKKLQ